MPPCANYSISKAQKVGQTVGDMTFGHRLTSCGVCRIIEQYNFDVISITGDCSPDTLMIVIALHLRVTFEPSMGPCYHRSSLKAEAKILSAIILTQTKKNILLFPVRV